MKRSFQLWVAAGSLLVAGLFPGTHVARGMEATAENPLTVTEICEKLKSGTTNADVFSALKSRRLLQKPTAADMANLRAAGIDAHLFKTDSGTASGGEVQKH